MSSDYDFPGPPGQGVPGRRSLGGIDEDAVQHNVLSPFFLQPDLGISLNEPAQINAPGRLLGRQGQGFLETSSL